MDRLRIRPLAGKPTYHSLIIVPAHYPVLTLSPLPQDCTPFRVRLCGSPLQGARHGRQHAGWTIDMVTRVYSSFHCASPPPNGTFCLGSGEGQVHSLESEKRNWIWNFK